MARTEARLLTSIWDDDDFIARPSESQRMYMFMLSQSDLAHDGVIALRERRWARKAAGLTVGDIEKALHDLDSSEFFVVDEDEEEVLVRSFIRRDKVFRQPNVLMAAAEHLVHVKSRRIRATLAVELNRILAEEDVTGRCRSIIAEMLGTLGVTLPGTHPTTPPTASQGNGRSEDIAPGKPVDNGVDKCVDGLQARQPNGQSVEGRHSAAAAEKPQVETLEGTLTGRDAVRDVNFVPGNGEEVKLSTTRAKDLPRTSFPAAPISETTSSSNAQQRAKRATRIPADFVVTDPMTAWAREQAPAVNVGRETEKFINYWSAKSTDATKLDWEKTWKNWMLTAAERMPFNGRASPGGYSGPYRDTNPQRDYTKGSL
jgi:hypothetical protein